MRQQHDENIYRIYSKIINQQSAQRDNKVIDNQFKNALSGLFRECVRFTKIVQNEKKKNSDILEKIDFGSYLSF